MSPSKKEPQENKTPEAQSTIQYYNGDCWLNDLWKYDIETQHWTCIQESSGPSSVLGNINNNIGADIDTANNNNNETHSNNNDNIHNNNIHPVSNITVRGIGPTRRFGYVSVVHRGKFILFGGFDVCGIYFFVVTFLLCFTLLFYDTSLWYFYLVL